MKAILELNETELDITVLEAVKTAFKGLDLKISIQVRKPYQLSEEEFNQQINQAREATIAYRLNPQDFDDFYNKITSEEEIDLKEDFEKFKIDLKHERS
jgi:hypothetical protein